LNKNISYKRILWLFVDLSNRGESPMPNPIVSPAGYTPVFALGFADGTSQTQIVAAGSPLPVVPIVAEKPAALAGTISASGQIGPFTPALRQAVMLTLAGTWTGTVTVLRSTDGGATRRGLTIAGSNWARFNANANEPVWEEVETDATLYLDVVLLSGAVVYRLAQ
jgi:hypothetical protein